MSMRETERGFTVAELIVAMIFLSLFIGLLFQMFLTSISQRSMVTNQAIANDAAMSNLRKITSKSSSLLTANCDSTNDLSSNPSAPGTPITFPQEDLSNTPLASAAQQSMTEFFPKGCDPSQPIKIVSTINYGSGSVSHVAYVN